MAAKLVIAYGRAGVAVGVSQVRGESWMKDHEKYQSNDEPYWTAAMVLFLFLCCFGVLLFLFSSFIHLLIHSLLTHRRPQPPQHPSIHPSIVHRHASTHHSRRNPSLAPTYNFFAATIHFLAYFYSPLSEAQRTPFLLHSKFHNGTSTHAAHHQCS